MSTRKPHHPPPAYLVHRGVLITLFGTGLLVLGYLVAQEAPVVWQLLLSLIRQLHGAWEAMNWEFL